MPRSRAPTPTASRCCGRWPRSVTRCREIGIPAYPQGHAFIADGPLLEALRAKVAFASYMTTQLCFDPNAIASWLAARRAEGIALPVHVGLPGVAEPQRLLAISARIGVADTHRFLVKNTRFIARLIRSGGFYRPDGLLEGLAPSIADPAAGIVDLHLYTFNAVDITERWRKAYLERLGVPRGRVVASRYRVASSPRRARIRPVPTAVPPAGARRPSRRDRGRRGGDPGSAPSSGRAGSTPLS